MKQSTGVAWRRLVAVMVAALLGGVLAGVPSAGAAPAPKADKAQAAPTHDHGPNEHADEHAHTHGPDGKDLDYKSRGRGKGGSTEPEVAPAAPYAVDTPAAYSASEYDGLAPTVDQPDVTSQPQFHAFYIYPADRASRFSQFAAMFQADAKQSSQRIAGLYGRSLRFDLRSGGYLDITVIKSTKTYSQLSVTNQFSVVRNELSSRGFLNNSNKKYVAWLDAGSQYCGEGELYNDARRTNDNYNQRRTLSIVYRPYSSTGADGGFCRGRTLAHELGHNMGALQPAAPHAFDGAHCNDSAEDVMCYTSATSNDTGGEAFDYANDDYWDPAANPSRNTTATLPWWTVNLSKYVCSDGNCKVGPTGPPPPNQAPVANFTSSCTNLSCTFTDSSTDADGTVSAWSWNFGDGTTATAKNPTKTYTTAGTYTVTLTVTDNAGTASTATSKSVNVTAPPPAPNQGPTAAFTSSCTYLACTFTDGSTDSDGTVTGWSWNFGDGTTSTLRNPSKTYATAGSYTVTLTVTDNAGATSPASQTFTVAPNQAPTASFTTSCSNLACTFTDTSTDSDGTVTGWNWTFGDGTTSTAKSPSKTYAAAGTYTVTLTVTDNAGARSSAASQSVTVTQPAGISLTATPWLQYGSYHHVDLKWSGAATSTVSVHRNGQLVTNTANDGAHTDGIWMTGSATYVYKLCNLNSTVCSPEVTVRF